MRIMEMRDTDGPNYWSARRHRLVVMLLDLEELEDRPTHTIPGFYERLTQVMPSLYEHRCSEGRPGGFFHRVQTGTWMGHVIEHLALEMQTLAGMNTGFGRTRGAGRTGLYHVALSCEFPEAGRFAAVAAVRMAESLIAGKPCRLEEELAVLREIAAKWRPGPSTAAILAEAQRRDIPLIRLNDDALWQLGYGAAQQRIEAAVTSSTSHIAVEIAADKAATKRLLAANAIPVPVGVTVRDQAGLDEAIASLGFPLALKPVDGNHGRGAALNVKNRDEALLGLQEALRHSKEAICERFVPGADFRVLVVNYRFTAAAMRVPPAVTGDGVHTLTELVNEENNDPRRGQDHEKVLTRIHLDPATVDRLARMGYTPDNIPAEGEKIMLKATANLSTGGTAEDVTDSVHPANRGLCERIARLIGLDLCGIDIIAPDLSTPLTANGGVVLEVNAGPGLRMHLQPSAGKPRNVAAPIVDMLFPNRSTGRIPIIAVTGTNGKTTTTRLIAQIVKKAGYRVGMTTTDGVYIDGQLISRGDCTGPSSARMVLKDPAVTAAVLECARGGILRSGLGFDKCDIAVITNIGEDHLGMQGIDTIEQLARLKGVLAEAVAREGYAVLNADDPNVLAIRGRLNCRIALFSMNADNPAIRQHVREGGIAAVYENGFLTVIEDGTMMRLGMAATLPVTFQGMAIFNIANALAAGLAGYLQGADRADLWQGLLQFTPDADTLPGRMNVFDFGGFNIIADYGHNAHSLRAIGDFLRGMPATLRVGVLAGVGDRRDEDIIALGAEAARIFDEIIIRQDTDLRGRNADELNGLVIKGIRQADPSKKITIVPDEIEALDALLRRAIRGMTGTFFADNIEAVIGYLQQALASKKYLLTEMQVA
jgi:cyanophycin synthetase